MPSSILGSLLFDKKPKVPGYPTVDIEKEQQAAIDQNAAALPSLEALGSSINSYNSDQINQQLERAMPGWHALQNRGTADINSMLGGEVPEDVKHNLERYMAARGVATGVSGSGFNTGNTLGAYGKTSYDIMSQGLSTARAWLADAERRAPVWDFTSMFVTPQQRISTKLQENQMIFQRNWLAAKIKAMPEGWQTAVKGLLDWISNTGASVVSAYAGGAMGGGGGMSGIGSMMGGGGGSKSSNYSDQFAGMTTAAPAMGIQDNNIPNSENLLSGGSDRFNQWMTSLEQ